MPRNKEKIKRLKDVQNAVKGLLKSLGRDLNDPELKDTPKRVAKLLIEEICEEENKDKVKRLLQWSPYPFASMVTLKGHRSYTRCPHHLERVELDIAISYIPDGRILGLSKLARIADFFSKGLMLQEEVTDSIAEAIEGALNPKGVAVYVKGRHMCMRARGVESADAEVITTCMKGVFKESIAAREEFLNAIRL